jgi:hypothetical protein
MMKSIGVTTCATIVALVGAACAPKPAQGPVPVVMDTVRVHDTVTVAGRPDPAQEQRMAVLQLRLLEKDAVTDDLQGRLDDAMREVVRAMAKLQSLATRAEAASAMAEAEVSTRQLRTAGTQGAADATRAQQLMALSNTEFQQQNYGGAVYLANQAKSVASTGGGRLSGAGADARPGETAFAIPLNLEVSQASNVREGPAARFAVVFRVERGAHLTGQSYVEAWVRVQDDAGKTGWIYSTALRAKK